MTNRREIYYAISLILGLVVGGLAAFFKREVAFTAGAIGLFSGYLFFALTALPQFTPDYLRRNAREADLPVTVMFVVVLVVFATISVSLFQVINEKQNPDVLSLVLALIAVVLAWCTVHVMYAIHYAHACWLDAGETDAKDDETPRRAARGLAFPGGDQPGGWDFLYFSAVIAMTAQTADTDITTTRLRRIVMGHSLLSYLFNTVIIAAAVNLAVSLGD